MHARALPWVLMVASLGCGSGRPNVDRFGGDGEGEDASGDDASGIRDVAPGIRLLSDVVMPRESESRGSGGAARDAIAREADTGRDADSSRDAPSLDGPFEGGRDSAVEAGRDAAVEAGRDAAVEAGRDAPTDIASVESQAPLDTGALVHDAAGGDGEAETAGEGGAPGDDANRDPFDACDNSCTAAANHLLLSEVVTRPSGAEMIEIVNPTGLAVLLSDYLLSDSHLYYKIASGTFTTASGSDFAARFPEGFVLQPGGYVVLALGNASGGSTSFQAVYGRQPDFELRPTANGADDDPNVPNMQPAQTSSIGATATLTDGGEPVVLFAYRGGDLVSDADYLFFGVPSSSNPVVDKTGVIAGVSSYESDTPGSAQHLVQPPGDGGSLHRCIHVESEEKRASGNGVTGHDETSEDASKAFVLGSAPSERTPGQPPPASLCGP